MHTSSRAVSSALQDGKAGKTLVSAVYCVVCEVFHHLFGYYNAANMLPMKIVKCLLSTLALSR